MKPAVNLASIPFRNRRLFWLVILLLFIIPAYFLMKTVETTQELSNSLSNQKMIVKGLENQVKVAKPATTNVTISTEQNRQSVTTAATLRRRCPHDRQ